MSAIFLLASPGNQTRLGENEVWNNLNFIEKLTTSIPVVSKNIFNLNALTNILPVIFITVVILNLLKNKDKLSFIASGLIIANIILTFLIDNNWLYFSLVVIIALSEFYDNYKKQRPNLTILSISLYAIVFSQIITPIYDAARPNYFFYLYMMVYIGTYISSVDFKKLTIGIYALAAGSFIVLCGNEVYVYNQIGNIHRERLATIKEFKETKQDVLKLKKVPNNLAIYHMEPNTPDSPNYFTYKYYLQYYGLDKDTKIQFVD
jgi:hypothetical protein